MATIELRSHKNPDHILTIFPSDYDDMVGQRAYSDLYISPRVVWADCMGDYPTRHTPYGLLNSDRMEEFLYTLALYLKANGANPAVAEFWPRNPSAELILRLHKLNVDKAKYFNDNSGETSNAKSKANDNRWREVPPWANGALTPIQIYGLMRHGWHNSLHRLVFWRVASRVLPGHWPLTPDFLPEGHNERREPLVYLLTCCEGYINAFRETEEANRLLGTYEEIKG